MIPLRPGAVLDSYRILRPLGSATHGEMYEAHDERLNRDVALKVIANDLLGNPQRLRRFRLEVQTLGKIRHPNIVEVYASGRTPQCCYLAMELVRGRSLAEIIAGGPQPIPEAVRLFQGILSGVRAVHDAKIVLRDLKPSNIMVTAAGVPRLMEFGLAKPNLDEPSDGTTTGVSLGITDYVAPETLGGAKAGVESDIYALGNILFELVTGRPIYPGKNPLEKLGQIRQGNVPTPSGLNAKVPPSLDTLILSMCAKEPSRRPSASDIQRDLGQVSAEKRVA